jgi:tetrapyrrole methylase family protein/MazG family protein
VQEELGDLLLQVYLQAEIAEEAGDFDVSDVIRGLTEKLIRRHPHVFGSVQVANAADVERNWEQLKQAEKGSAPSTLGSVPLSLPALARAREVQRKVSKAGFDWPRPDGALAKLDEELSELRAVLDDPVELAKELGDVLFMLVKVAGDRGIDAEAALRGTIERVVSRFEYLERAAAASGTGVGDLGIERLLELWEEAKRAEQSRE